MGAMLGSAYGAIAHHLLPGLATSAGGYGLVGMGAVFAAAARAPITGLIIIFELTGDYQIILPLMFAIVVKTALSNAITRDTVYTLKLRRRGIEIDSAQAAGLMTQITVAQAMGRPPRPIRPDDTLLTITGRFAKDRVATLPVADTDGTLVGVLAAADVEQAITHPDTTTRHAAADLARDVPRLHAHDTLEHAIIALGATEDDGLPVVDDTGQDQLLGWLTHRRLLRAYRSRLPHQPGKPLAIN